MLIASHRKIIYMAMALVTGLMLLSVPTIVPSTYADCSTASSCSSQT